MFPLLLQTIISNQIRPRRLRGSKPEEQTVPGFSGFHARMSNAEEKSRPIFHRTYFNPPSKTILNDVI